MQIFSVFFHDAVAGGGREEEKCVKAPHWRVELSEKITLSKFELSLDVCTNPTSLSAKKNGAKEVQQHKIN